MISFWGILIIYFFLPDVHHKPNIIVGEIMEPRLTIGGIISNSINIGLKNSGSIIGAIVLWVLTIWIPYLNVGTTIGLLTLVVVMSKGGVVSPTEIFKDKYRQYMGEFFLLVGFLTLGVTIGYAFMIIPGIVISVAWGQALYLMVDKGMNPTEALTTSNKITYGHKLTIFIGKFVLVVVLMIAVFIVAAIFRAASNFLGGLVVFVGYLLAFSISFAADAYIYGELVKKLDPPAEESPLNEPVEPPPASPNGPEQPNQ